MCDPVVGAPTIAFMAANAAPIAAAGAVTAAGASIYSGVAQNKLAQGQAAADEEQGRAEQLSSIERAARIRMQGQKFLSEQRVAQNTSGVEGSSGSALEVGMADAAEIELDALTEMYGGQNRRNALKQQAGYTRAAGKVAQTVGFVRGASDILGAGKTWEALGGY